MDKINKIQTQQGKGLFTFYKQQQENPLQSNNNQIQIQKIQEVVHQQIKRKSKKKLKSKQIILNHKNQKAIHVKANQITVSFVNKMKSQKKLKETINLDGKKANKHVNIPKKQDITLNQLQGKQIQKLLVYKQNNQRKYQNKTQNSQQKTTQLKKQRNHSLNKCMFSQTKLMIRPFQNDPQYEMYQNNDFQTKDFLNNPQKCQNNDSNQKWYQIQQSLNQNNISQKFLSNIFRNNQKSYVSKNNEISPQSSKNKQNKSNQVNFPQIKNTKHFYKDKIFNFDIQRSSSKNLLKQSFIRNDKLPRKQALKPRLVRMKTQQVHSTHQIFANNQGQNNYSQLKRYIQNCEMHYSNKLAQQQQTKDQQNQSKLPSKKCSFSVHQMMNNYHKRNIQKSQKMVQYFRRVKKNTNQLLRFSMIKNYNNNNNSQVQRYECCENSIQFDFKVYKKRSITEYQQNNRQKYNESPFQSFQLHNLQKYNRNNKSQQLLALGLHNSNKKLQLSSKQKKYVKLPSISNKSQDHANNSPNNLSVNFYHKTPNLQEQDKNDLKDRVMQYKQSIQSIKNVQEQIMDIKKVQTQQMKKVKQNRTQIKQQEWLRKKVSSSKILKNFHQKYYNNPQTQNKQPKQIISMLDMSQNCIFNVKQSFDWQMKKRQLSKKYKFKM